MKRILSTSVNFILLLSLGMMYPLAEATADCVHQPVVELEDSGVQGQATLCVNTDGVDAKMKMRNLTPGNTYTIWFAYIDRPDLCAMGPGVCTPVDFGVLAPSGDASADPLGVFGRLDSTVADENGKENFSGRVGGLRLSSGSQVLLVFYTDGPAVTNDKRRLARQLLTPEDPFAGAPGLGITADGQLFTPNAIVIFNIP